MTTDASQGGGEGAARLSVEIADAERRERERLAEALHDDALQRLLVVRQDLADGSDDAATRRSVSRQLTELTESLRSLTRAMHEESLAAMPLQEALERLAEDAARRGRLVVSTRVDPAATGDHDPFVLGVVRELLANVVKHAHATRAEVVVAVAGTAVRVRVSDDGLGTTTEDLERAARAGHLGHARLARRLASVGGTIDLGVAAGPGTTVTCTIPLENLGAQRTLEDALRRERRWSSALVAAMQDGFVVFRDGRAAQVNDRFCTMTGFSREELVDRPAEASAFWPPERGAELARLVADAATAGGTDGKATLVRADGTRFPALVAARAIRDDEGHAAGLLVTVKDVTALEEAAERRRLELELGAVVDVTNRLRGLLDAARAVTDDPGLGRLLAEVARTIAEDLGWGVAIHLYRPSWDDFVATTSHGLPPEEWAALEGATSRWAEWTPRLDDRHERRGAYLVPAGAPGAGAWQPGDDLLVPFRHTQGHFLGIMALRSPASGRHPTDAELDVLVALAAHAALAVQHAQTAIELARHAAALDSLLEVSSLIAATRRIEPMLRVVADAVGDALGFGRVVVELVGSEGALLPQAVRDDTAPSGAPAPAWAPVTAQDLAGVMDPAFAVEGCFLLGADEAAARMPAARRELLSSRRNGQGWRAWQDHVVLVPLHGPDDEVVGALWVDDPEDRLLPTPARLQALHAFANQASAAMIAADSYERLASVARGDPLTQLGNRRAFVRELEREATRAARTGASAVLVLADVQGCDSLLVDAERSGLPGSAGGLRELAGVFEAELRRHDQLFRIEGTLFAMLLTGGQRPPETAAVTTRLAARLQLIGRREGASVTFGTATIGPRSEGADAVLRRAGQSLVASRRLTA